MTRERLHNSFEDAFTDTLHYSPDPVTGHVLTVREIATDINVRAGMLQDAGDPHRGQPIHATWIVPIIKRTKNYAIVRFICHAVGGVFVKLPEATSGKVAGLVAVISDVMKEVADVVKVASEAIADNNIDATEQAALLQQITEAEAALETAKSLVIAMPIDGRAPRKGSRR